MDLNLSTNNLSGEIPLTFVDLTALQRMDLSGNALSGPVSSLPPLLLDLKLNNNQFTDLSVITPLLSVADVSFNELVTLGDLTGNNLMTLKVEDNNLTFEDLEPNVSIPESRTVRRTAWRASKACWWSLERQKPWLQRPLDRPMSINGSETICPLLVK